MAFTESDVFLNDFGVAVVFGSYTGKGILDMPTEILAGDMVLSSDYQLTIKTSDFPTIAHNSNITVGGTAYRVKQVRKLDDGIFSVAFLSK